ncbi:MAG: AEC family transporter [Proteobacteria bacterium]|jgi:malonate transporter|nr:AEC family transporter [Pseudomonadota bacterium]MDA1237992.1 AEC family transporter [Pseudomonadota bacterium]
MSTLIQVLFPVFLVLSFGYVSVKCGWFTTSGVEGLMTFTQKFAIPCLLFNAMATLEISSYFNLNLLISYFIPALFGFILGTLASRIIFKKPWENSIVIGFCCFYSNALLLGLPIMERAYGPDSLAPNYALIALNTPFCYAVGIVLMEIVKGSGKGFSSTVIKATREIFSNILVISILAGILVNVLAIKIPNGLVEALGIMMAAALPAAIFGLGGVLARYKLDADLAPVFMVGAIMLLFQPYLTWTLANYIDLKEETLRSVILTSAMAPGLNAYIFANMYGVSKKIAASSILFCTASSTITLWMWLSMMP